MCQLVLFFFRYIFTFLLTAATRFVSEIVFAITLRIVFKSNKFFCVGILRLFFCVVSLIVLHYVLGNGVLFYTGVKAWVHGKPYHLCLTRTRYRNILNNVGSI